MGRPPESSTDLYHYAEKLKRWLGKVRPILREYVAYLRLCGLGESRQLKHLQNIVRFERRYLSDIHLEKVSFKKFEDAFNELLYENKLDNDTKYVYKVSLAKYFEFLLKKKRGNKRVWKKILELLKDVRIKSSDPKIVPISDDEFRKMYEAAEDFQTKAILSVLYEAGLRSGELLSCRVGDARIHDSFIEIVVSGKTGEGTVILVKSYRDLINHLQNHPLKDNPNAPLWFLEIGNKIKPLTYGALRMRLRRLAEKAGIKRRIYVHLFRHTAATQKAAFLTDREMCEYFRWSAKSKMPSRYSHLSQRNVRNKILSLYNQNYKPEELKVQKCWRCGEILPANVRFCPRCGAPQESSEIYRNIMKRQEADELMDILIQHPKVRAAIAEALRELYESHRLPSSREPLDTSKVDNHSSSSNSKLHNNRINR